MGSRRFTEKEAAEIMRKAAENQSQSRHSASSEGFSEEELHAAARELGIEPNAMTAAIESFGDAAERGKSGFFGGPFVLSEEFVVEGTMTDEKWEEILANIRKTFGEAGTIDRRGTTYEWVGTGGGVFANTVTIREAGDSVRVRLDSNMGGVGALTYILSMLPTVITVGILAKLNIGSALGLTIGSVLVLVYFLLARAYTTWLSAKSSREIRSFLSQVRRHIEAGTALRPNLSAPTAQAADTEEPINLERA